MSQNTSLVDWLTKLGISKELNNYDIMGGITVNSVLNKIVTNYSLKMSPTNTAANRINNWNNLIVQLQKINMPITQQQKSKILNGDDKIVYNILFHLKEYYDKSRLQVQVDINSIDYRSDPRGSKSLLELFILVIIKHYGFSIKEAVALLSNDSKYLAHILAKGFKDNPKPVQDMLKQLQSLLPHIIKFCKNKENQMFFLKSVKPGLISKFLTISESSLSLITEYLKNVSDKYEILKTQLIGTLVLCLRRHSCQLSNIIRNITQILGYNKNLLTLFLSHGNHNECCLLMIQLFNVAQQQKNLEEMLGMFKLDEFLNHSLQNLKNKDFFINAGSFLIKMLEHNYNHIIQNQDNSIKIVQNLSMLELSKRGDVLIHINLIFAFLHLFGRKKHAIAPQLYKLAVEKYKNSLNEEESHNYLLNFLQIIEIFPSIPANSIADAIILRYQHSTTYIGQLQLDILLNSIDSIDEKLALRIYNIITKIFVEQVGSSESISNVLETIIRKFETKIIFDITVRFTKICLAVHYANIRKLNYSKSLVQGTIKLDKSNIFYKAKNVEIQKLLMSILSIRDERLNKALEPLVCYSYIQSQMKNKEQAEGIRKVMIILGDEEELRKLYQADAKLMLQDVRNEGRKDNVKEKVNKHPEGQSRMRVSSDASLLLKKKQFLYEYSKAPKLPLDIQKGLQKYNKVYVEKMTKISLQQQRKMSEEQRKQELRKKFTIKIMQKGIKISKEFTVNCIYEYGTKQRQNYRDQVAQAHLPFYDPEYEEQRDIKALQYILKKYSRLLKLYYNNYGGKLRPNTIKLFQELSEKAHLMQSANVWRLLKDHGLDEYITHKEVHYIVQKTNAHMKKQCKDIAVLDFETFQNLIVQLCLVMFSRPPRDLRSYPISFMVQELINKLQEYAHQNRIDARLFEDEVIHTSKEQQIKELNTQLKENPDYILPEGYKKHVSKQMSFDYSVIVKAVSEAQKDVIQILNSIMFERLGFNIIEPYSNITTVVTARPVLYTTRTDYNMKQRSLSSAIPRQSKNIRQSNIGEGQENPNPNNEDNPVGNENIQQKYLSSKIQNKFLKEKKLKEQQRKKRQEQQIKKREQRDREIKDLLQKHKGKLAEVTNDKEQKKREEQRKVQEQKRKRQKYEEDLKKKVEEFTKKKQQDKQKEQQNSKKKKEEEIKLMQRMKQDIERKKKLVQQHKTSKQQEQKAKLTQEQQQKKRKLQEQKSKLAQKKEKNKKMLEQFKEKRQQSKQVKEGKPKDQIKKTIQKAASKIALSEAESKGNNKKSTKNVAVEDVS